MKKTDLKEEIKSYYNDLASEYDHLRFSNSYGRYIHQQEDIILSKYLDLNSKHKNLDIACGTGRFLKYADYGIDISEEMIKNARDLFPEAKLYLGDAESLPFEDEAFENVICFHLMMHLDNNRLNKIIREANRVIQKGGYFIFDIPSEKRRNLIRYKSDSWHGSNNISKEGLLAMISGSWELINFHGVAFFPIHRIPKFLRKKIVPVDNIFSNSIFKEYASHLIFILKKK